MPERTPREKETLMFATPETAQAWRERVSESLAMQRPGVRADREVVSQAVAHEFEAAGEAVATIRHPWEHTPAEHEEVQQLVDEAFVKDLPAALATARKSPHYPRNLDLFHDLLTSEMYEHVKMSGLSKQPLMLWVTEIVVIVLLAALGVLLLLVTAT